MFINEGHIVDSLFKLIIYIGGSECIFIKKSFEVVIFSEVRPVF